MRHTTRRSNEPDYDEDEDQLREKKNTKQEK
jgi:hypothetical protein